jgi:hypothetical protein
MEKLDTILPEMLICVAVRCNWKTFINILRVHKFSQTDKIKMWKLKCEICYPDCTYFEFLSGIENFLINDKFFTVIYGYTPTEIFCDNIIQEYNEVIARTINFSNKYFPHVEGETGLLCLPRFKIKKQFIIIKDSARKCEVSLLSQHSSLSKCEISMLEDKNLNTDEEIVLYTIIDLEFTILSFLAYGNIFKPKNGQEIYGYESQKNTELVQIM